MESISQPGPGDIVRLNGTTINGLVLDWSDQLPINQRQLATTHFAIQPISRGQPGNGQIAFWPRDAVRVMTKNASSRRISIIEEPELRI